MFLVWDIKIDLGDDWYNAQVDAVDGTVQSLVNWVCHASFNVFPLGINDPSVGDRHLEVNPENNRSSPLGWNQRVFGKRIIKYKVTKGNNVYAQNNPNGGNEYEGKDNHRPDGGPELNFAFELDLHKQPKKYVDVAITNLFYYNNIMHDLFYLYGFDEVAGNFQDDNFKRGGKGNDAVVAWAQDGK